MAVKHLDPNAPLRKYRTTEYPNQIWYLLSGFIGLLFLFHVGTLIAHWRRRKRLTPSPNQAVEGEKAANTNEERDRSTNNSNISLRRIPIALVNSFRIVAYRIPLPIGGGSSLNGAELGIAAGYIISLFTWEFINCTNITTGAKLDTTYWANRAANIVTTQLPLMVLLAGKNNMISLLTGISYEQINVLHRVAARVCLILVWVHFGGRVKLGLTGSFAISHPWVRTGIAVAMAYTLLVLISFRPLRTRFYEFFFFSHFVLVLMIMIGAYYHIRLTQGASHYLIPTFVFWVLDRALRSFRLIRNNQPSSRNKSALSMNATAKLLSPTMVRLTLKRHMTWRAGQSVFITMPGVSSIPFEAHPFTIASIPRGLNAGSTNAVSSGPSSEEEATMTPLNEMNELVILVKAKEGFTRRLRDVVSCGSSKDGIPLSIYVDGPYGSPPGLDAFETVVLIAGGSGISYVLPLLQDIIQKVGLGKSVCKNVVFVWIVPDRRHLSWVARDIHESIEIGPPSMRLYFQLHVTGRSGSDSGSDTNSEQEHTDTKYSDDQNEDVLGDKLLPDGCISIRTGRPNIRATLEKELVEGTASVNVAGPPELIADVKKALRFNISGPKAVLTGGPDVTLHVETYGIA